MSRNALVRVYPSWKLAAYASPAIPISAIGIPLIAYLPAYYASQAGLSLGLVGTVFLVVRLADIALDPVVGTLMDRNRTRWGRFKPWLIAGAFPMAVASYMLFNPAGDVTLTYLTIWLSIVYAAYSICYLAHLSWGMSLTMDYNERSRVFGFWQAGALLGSISVLATPILVEGVLGYTHAAGIRSMGILIAALVCVTVCVAVAFMPEPPAASERQTRNLTEYLTLIVRPTIARLLVADLVIGTALGMNSALFFFYFAFIKHFSQLEIVILLFLNMCGSLFGTPVWTYLTDKIGKHRAAAFAFALYALSLIMIQLVPPHMLLNCVILFVAGLTLSAGPLLLRSMLADAGDEELLRSGVDQTGVLSAIFTGTNKIGLAIAPGITFLILGAFNFSATVPSNPEGALVALQALYVFAPAALGCFVAVLIRGHSLTAERHAQILLQIREGEVRK
ncbi:MFS transporter [Hyphomonas sp. NPDC076900]|uniref:MFS transporter n=1 Tax=unclassified Hyphomonas TaxID=2630699 RepID=UPI003D06E1F7